MSSPLAGKAFRILYTAWCLEAGAFLAMVPWSRVWTQNVVSAGPASLQALLHSPFFRGFVTGVGLIHVAAAVLEIDAWRRSALSRLARDPGNGTGA